MWAITKFLNKFSVDQLQHQIVCLEQMGKFSKPRTVLEGNLQVLVLSFSAQVIVGYID
jgi:hypothetical protein